MRLLTALITSPRSRDSAAAATAASTLVWVATRWMSRHGTRDGASADANTSRRWRRASRRISSSPESSTSSCSSISCCSCSIITRNRSSSAGVSGARERARGCSSSSLSSSDSVSSAEDVEYSSSSSWRSGGGDSRVTSIRCWIRSESEKRSSSISA